MYVDDRDGAWIAAADGQLNHIAAGERTARTLCETAAPAFAFTADAASVYCATPGEVVRVGKQTGKVDRLPGGEAPLTAIVADSVRSAVYAGSRSGELYRVAGDRLARLDPKGARPRRIRGLAAAFIRICALCMPINALANACYFTLRSGGKTFVTFLFDSFYVCVLTVPMAFVLSRFTGLPIVPLFLCCQLADIGKCVVGLIMIRRGVWIQNIVGKEAA